MVKRSKSVREIKQGRKETLQNALTYKGKPLYTEPLLKDDEQRRIARYIRKVLTKGEYTSTSTLLVETKRYIVVYREEHENVTLLTKDNKYYTGLIGSLKRVSRDMSVNSTMGYTMLHYGNC